MVAQTEPRVYPAVSQRRLWLSLATGAVVWSLHLVVSYALASLACERGLFLGIFAGFAVVRWTTILLTVLAAC